MITVRRVLDVRSGARLLRLIDARLSLLGAWRDEVRHVIVDLTAIEAATGTGAVSVDRAWDLVRRKGAWLHVVAAPHILTQVPGSDRARLVALVEFSSVEAALSGLAPPVQASS